jgi:hypothetical protein
MLLVAIVGFGCVCWWSAYSIDWIRQREQFRTQRAIEFQVVETTVSIPGSATVRSGEPAKTLTAGAPGCLWMFGERGRYSLFVKDPGDLAAAKRLFPESRVWTSGENPTADAPLAR